ncbi:hypothetical protein ACWOFR_08610 [Carnobacterium gallinarum]|uniref:hypothetical protein n=1 Tax=Carnobacterium gallinarum TaxID=2749 RepID=UPI000558A21D|nr:hypothetical protein [Carnobacterium gallinarum]
MTKSYSYKEIIESGKIDVEKAKASGYVTMEEKEKLGYYTIDASSNRGTIKRAYEQKDEIYAHIREEVETSLGRDIKILGMEAPFPYDAVDITFVSVDEPIVKDMMTISLSDNGYFSEGATKSEAGNGFQEDVIIGLYFMAYKEEIKEMSKYIEETYPQYQGFPANLMDYTDKLDPFIMIHFTIPDRNIERMDNAEKEKAELFALYKDNPIRSDEEWKQLFEEKTNLDFLVNVNLVIRDESKIPTEKMANEILDDIKINPLFKNYFSYGTMILSNLWDTKRNHSLIRENYAWTRDQEKVGDSSNGN